MLFMRRDIDVITSPERNRFCAFESNFGRALENDDPFILYLIIPAVFRRGMSLGYDALDSNVRFLGEKVNDLLCQILWDIIKYIEFFHWAPGRQVIGASWIER